MDAFTFETSCYYSIPILIRFHFFLARGVFGFDIISGKSRIIAFNNFAVYGMCITMENL